MMDVNHEIEQVLVKLFTKGFPGVEFIPGSDRTAEAKSYPYAAVTVTTARPKTPSGRMGIAEVDMLLVANLEAISHQERRDLWSRLLDFLQEAPQSTFRNTSEKINLCGLIMGDTADSSENQLVGDLVKFRIPYTF